jgi:hypothetical protein
MPATERKDVESVLVAAEHALRSYELGNDSTALAAEIADAIAKLRNDHAAIADFRAGFTMGVLSAPSEAMLEAGQRTLVEDAPMLATPRELVRAMCDAMVKVGIAERYGPKEINHDAD